MEKKFGTGKEELLLSRDNHITLRTKEGTAAVKEAIEFLKKQDVRSKLKWSDQVAKAAEDH
jgi:hypothetical protein